MDIITGKTGAPHVTSQQDREINQAIFGDDNVVLNVGFCFEAVNAGNNTITIRDGLLMLQGTGASIQAGASEQVKIANGSQGVGRIDYICAKYERKVPDDTESIELTVIQGTASASPRVPNVPAGNIRNGDLTAYFPLYKVTLDGVSVSEIEPIFKFAAEKKILYTGPQQMGAGVEINLSEQVSRQKTGLALIWSPYGTAGKENLHYQYIPKETIMLFGETTHSIFLCNTNFTKVACKSVIVKDDCILGNQYNMTEGQHNGIVFNNADYTLRYVLGY